MTQFGDPPTNEKEFEEFMTRVDRSLAERGIPIVGRQLAAVGTICAHVVGSRPVPTRREPRLGVYGGDDLLLRAMAWYDTRYGERLKVDFGNGRTVFWLRGDLWAVYHPSITGPAVFIAGEDEKDIAIADTKAGLEVVAASEVEARYPGIRQFDVRDFIEELTESLRLSLSANERKDILFHVCTYRHALFWLTLWRGFRFVESARGEFRSTVDHLMQSPPNVGHALWASQMGLEKLMKSYIHHSGGVIAHHHDLRKHARQLQQLGFGEIAESALAKVRCTASVRYDQPTDLERGATALLTALQIAGVIAHTMYNRWGREGLEAEEGEASQS